MSNTMILITTSLFAAVRMAVPLTYAGIGESVAQTSGVLNIGVEGMMLSGAFFSFLVTSYTGSILIGVLAGMLAGMLFGVLHAYISVTAKQNQTISGLAINFLVLGLTSFLFLVFFGDATSLPSVETLPVIPLPLLSKIPVIGSAFFSHDILTYILYIVIILSTIYLKKTDYGTRMEAVGENPRAADTAGINVNKIRYLSSLFNGLMCGLAGSYMMVVQFGFYIENLTAGRGYIALAAVTLGSRNPVAVFFVSLLIGMTEGLQFTLQSIGVPIPSQVFSMMPYLVAVVVLLLSIGRSKDPAALGQPYDRMERE
ncbi:MAG TPA: ABC transporter permease [Fastidiosipila sp.]|nr:ABC transporter permease [Fastidiosipila sp.]